MKGLGDIVKDMVEGKTLDVRCGNCGTPLTTTIEEGVLVVEPCDYCFRTASDMAEDIRRDLDDLENEFKDKLDNIRGAMIGV